MTNEKLQLTNKKKNIELRERLLDFSVSIIQLLKEVPYRKEYDVLRYQLSKSATSIGANYEESQSSTYKEFLQRVKIALREANETKYWLTIIERLSLCDKEKLTLLSSEANEISLILGSIASKVDKKIKGGN
jgi:four helix bundle protein